MEARGRQEGGLAAMSQLGFDLSVDEGGGGIMKGTSIGGVM